MVGVFPNETSATILATEIALRSSEEWVLKRYLTMGALEAVEKPNPQLSRRWPSRAIYIYLVRDPARKVASSLTDFGVSTPI